MYDKKLGGYITKYTNIDPNVYSPEELRTAADWAKDMGDSGTIGQNTARLASYMRDYRNAIKGIPDITMSGLAGSVTTPTKEYGMVRGNDGKTYGYNPETNMFYKGNQAGITPEQFTGLKAVPKKPLSAANYNAKSNFYKARELVDGDTRRDMTVDDVKDIQKRLGVTADGKWGPKTEAAYINKYEAPAAPAAPVVTAPAAPAAPVVTAPVATAVQEAPVWDFKALQDAPEVTQATPEESGLAGWLKSVPEKDRPMAKEVARILGNDTGTAGRLFR